MENEIDYSDIYAAKIKTYEQLVEEGYKVDAE